MAEGASYILFKFKGQRAAEEKVVFDGVAISSTELKNLIAEKKGLDTTKDTYQLLNPKDGSIFDETTSFVRGMRVLVRRVPVQQPVPRKQLPGGAAAGVEEEEAPNQMLAFAQALAAVPAGAAADPSDEQAQLEQRKARQAITDIEAQAVAEATQAAWQAQTDQHIRQTRQREQQLAAQGRGRGHYGRGFGGRGPGSVPPICRYCGAVNAHFPDECPQRHAPRTDLRHVRAPTGIPASYVREDDSGGLLLNTGKTGTVRTSDAEASSIFAALPAARRAAMAAAKAAQVPALADRPHEASDEGLLQTLLLDIEPAAQQEQELQQGQQQLEQGQQQQQQQLRLEDLAAGQQHSPLSQQGQRLQQQPDGVDGMPLDDDTGAGLEQPGPAAAAAAAGGGGGAPAAGVGGGLGLFDDVDLDLLPPAAAEGEGLNLGIGMELDQPVAPQQPPPQPQQSQQHPQKLEQPGGGAGSPLAKQLQLVPARSPVVQAVQEAVPGLQLTDTLAEQLRYSSDILRPWSHWDLQDVIPGFFAAKPLLPDEYAEVIAKYRERRRAASKQREQQRRQAEQQQRHAREQQQRHAREQQQRRAQEQQELREQWANGEMYDRRDQHWEDSRHRARPAPSPIRSPRAEPGNGDPLDRTRSRRERVFEREARDTNRLLRKEREREVRRHSTSRSRSRSRSRAQAHKARSISPQHAPSPSPARNPSSAERRRGKGSKRSRDEDSKARARSRSRDRSASREGREAGRDVRQAAGRSKSREAAEELEPQAAKRQRSASPGLDGVVAEQGGREGDARPQPGLQNGGVSADLRNLLTDSASDQAALKPSADAPAAAAVTASVAEAAGAAAAPKPQPGSKPPTPKANGNATTAEKPTGRDDRAAGKDSVPAEEAARPNIFDRLGCMAPRLPHRDAPKPAAEAHQVAAAQRGRSPSRPKGRSASRSRSRGRGRSSPKADHQQQEREQQRGRSAGGESEEDEVLDVGDEDDEAVGEGEGAVGGGDARGDEVSTGKKDKKHKKHKKHKKKKRRRERHGDDTGDAGGRHHSRSRSRSRGREDHHHRSRSREDRHHHHRSRSGERRHRSRSREYTRDVQQQRGHHGSREGSPQHTTDRPSKRVRGTNEPYDSSGQQVAAEPRTGRSVHDRLGSPHQHAAGAAGGEGRASGRPTKRNPGLGVWGAVLQQTLSTQGSAEQRHGKHR